MDFIDPILSIASEIYDLVETVKANRKRCRRVAERVRALEELVTSIKQQQVFLARDGVEKALEELKGTLESAREIIRKYTMANWMKRVMKAGSHEDDFSAVNERLNDAYQVLSGALQVEQGNMLSKVFELTSRKREDESDIREDTEELKSLMLEFMRDQQENNEVMQKKVENVVAEVGKFVGMLDKPCAAPENIRMIKLEELKYEQKPFMKTATSEVYKGEFNGFPVAIKRYLDPKSTSPGEVEKIFQKEVDTMKRFESPHILRMFGICVQCENPSSPEFLIIMEYCEKGSLRQVLDSSCNLSWPRKARMCLDAAQGLYRLHQTEEKSKVHGCINSSKFLVADGYRVKLGGFELSKTETSLRRQSKSTETSSLCYHSPQKLNNINYKYTKQCEMYSVGIVLWEVATRRRPFEGCSREQIHHKVVEEKFQEPLPDDCPEALGELISACRAYDSFRRPSAGVLVDKLRKVVEQLEE